jgi:hypothetical protein
MLVQAFERLKLCLLVLKDSSVEHMLAIDTVCCDRSGGIDEAIFVALL